MNNLNFKWFILKVAGGGKEQHVCENIIDRLFSYGMENNVKNLQIIKVAIIDKQVILKNDLPKNLNDTSTVQWEANDDGTYNKITKKENNRYPGYCFINMAYTPELWEVIRNTGGVYGFANNKAAPIPNSQYQKAIKSNKGEFCVEFCKDEKNEYISSNDVKPEYVVESDQQPQMFNFQRNMTVEILKGKFIGLNGLITDVDKEKQEATINVVDINGSEMSVVVPFSDIKSN